MSLFKSNLLRFIQPVFVRTAKTSTAGSAKAAEPKDTKDEHFLDENEGGKDTNESPSVGRERSLNRIQLIGRVGADPKVGGTQRHKVITFNLATNEYAGTNTADGEVKQRVDWHRIAVFQPRLLENVEKYVRQGDRLYVQGRLHHNLIKDKNTGNDRYVTSIIGDDLIFLTKR